MCMCCNYFKLFLVTTWQYMSTIVHILSCWICHAPYLLTKYAISPNIFNSYLIHPKWTRGLSLPIQYLYRVHTTYYIIPTCTCSNAMNHCWIRTLFSREYRIFLNFTRTFSAILRGVVGRSFPPQIAGSAREKRRRVQLDGIEFAPISPSHCNEWAGLRTVFWENWQWVHRRKLSVLLVFFVSTVCAKRNVNHF